MDLASNGESELTVLRPGDALGNTLPHRVLVVDDDGVTAETFALVLHLSAFDADFVLTGAQALSRALAAPPDAVVLDLHLADDDIPGFLVLKSLRAKYPELPIVVVTGWYVRDEHEDEARALGVTDYLFKPVGDTELVASLRSVVAGTARDPVERSKNGAGAEGSTNGEGVGLELAACENGFIEHFLPYLARTIQHAFPKVWPDVILEKVEDTLLEFVADLKCGIWPVRGTVAGHLRQAAWRNVRDWIRATVRRRANEARYARECAQLTNADDAEPADRGRLLTLTRSEAENEALRVWSEGGNALEIAEALGVSYLPASEQLREVKRFKDRIKKRAGRSR